MKNRISRETWEQARTAYAAGIGLRELARKTGIPEGTMAGTRESRALDAADCVSKGPGGVESAEDHSCL